MTTASPSAVVAGRTPDVARRRSNSELLFLVLALLIVLVAYAQLGITRLDRVPTELTSYAGAMGILALLAHVVRRRTAPAADPVLLPTAFLLNGLGLVMMRRMDYVYTDAGRLTDFAASQTIWTVVGVGAFVATLFLIRDAGILDRYRYLIGFSAIILLLLPLLPVVGTEVNGARLWLQAGGLSFQPGELAKLALVAFFASYLAEYRPLLTVATSRLGPIPVPAARAFGPILVVWGISLVVLVFERDLGLSLLIFGLFVSMLYVATGRGAYPILGGLLFGGGAFAAWTLFGHVQTRVEAWLTPYNDPFGDGFQILQSMYALAAGGLVGTGWGEGLSGVASRFPEMQNDFIFSVFGEELGLLGTTAIILCFLILTARGFSIALRTRDEFQTLLALGLTVVFGLQVFVIIGGVTRLIPLTGLTLPFMSAGGSSLVANYILVALLMRVSAGEDR
jgi:cell division protein FtsW (lipid II flippase)